MKKAHVTHPELKCTFCLDILGVKKNPNGQTYTSLGVITKGTIIEVGFAISLGHIVPDTLVFLVLFLCMLQPGDICLCRVCVYTFICCISGECERAGARHARRQGGVGQVRPGMFTVHRAIRIFVATP